MTQFFKLVAELGLPIAATVGMGVFILFIIKYILNGIVSSIKFIETVISQLDNRVKTMNNDIYKDRSTSFRTTRIACRHR